MHSACDIVVIGGGLFGQIIAKTLRGNGKHVVIVDNNQPTAGSRPAACLMKPSWFSGFSQEDIRASLQLLEDFYELQMLSFTVSKIKKTGVYWINPQTILSGEKTIGDVKFIDTKNKGVFLEGGKTIYAHQAVIVAAGIWSSQLINTPKIEGKAGCAFVAPGQIRPFINPWAPYKQIVGFNWKPEEIWIGDGTSINYQNWKIETTEKCYQRCSKYLSSALRPIFGIRPHVKGFKPCYLKEEHPGIWVATGGAKNGTLAAAWCADKLRKELA